MRLCVKDGLIIDPVNNSERIGTVFAEGDRIVCVKTENVTDGTVPAWENGSFQTVDAGGKWITPPFIDLHVHFRDPGFEYKEDITSGCAAARKGGFAAVCCMPNTKPAADCGEVVSYIKHKAAAVKGVTVFVIGTVTKGQAGKELADIDEMAKMGICAISEDGKSVMDSGLMREAMIKARALGLPFFSHAEDENLAGLPIGEEIIVARDILLAKETGCKLHLCHISTRGSVDIIRKAKAAGIAVTAETAPHYFTLDESCVGRDGNRKMNPPLRAREDVISIKEALADGTIDAIATDHAPHASSEKAVCFENAPNGVIGLETSFAISYTALVKTGLLTPAGLMDKMSAAPAAILGIKPPRVAAGESADIIIADIENEYEISGNFASKSANSPFIGARVYGKPRFLSESM